MCAKGAHTRRWRAPALTPKVGLKYPVSWMVVSRRSALRAFCASGLAPLLAPLASCVRRAPPLGAAVRAAAATGRSDSRPRYLILVNVNGGLDAVLTTDPKRASDVDEGIDVPYGVADTFEVDGRQFGSHLAPMRSWLPSFAVINNVEMNTVSHSTGNNHFFRLRRSIRGPLISDVVGWHRDTQAIGAITVGGITPGELSRGVLGCAKDQFVGGELLPNLCDHLDSVDPVDLERAALALDSLGGDAATDPETRRHASDTARFFRAYREAPQFRAQHWFDDTDPRDRNVHDEPRTPNACRDFQRVLWLLEHDLAKAVNFVCVDFFWDSHTNNLSWQRQMNQAFFPILERFMSELGTRHNQHGVLAEQTLLVMGSELGRFPRLNGERGKDHLPEAPLFIYGPGVRSGTYGVSGRRMEGLPVSLATGHYDDRGRVINVDDIGTTVLGAFGIDPVSHGYWASHLDFVLARNEV